MIRLAIAACLLPLALALRPAPSAPVTGNDLDSLAWLAGPWVIEAQGVSVEERWIEPKGGTMLGVNRTVRGERTVAFEFLRIEQREDEIVYVAHPGARSPGTEFTLTESGEGLAVFRNPEHDFPTLIGYERQEDGSMIATIGGGESGEDSQQRFPYRRPEGFAK